MKPVIFTDLDGTLLDEGYSFEAALPVIKRIKAESIPLVPVTSKTRAEVESLLARLEVKGPFVTENGGGVFIPDNAFPFPVEGERTGGMLVLRLGTAYEEIRSAFTGIRDETGFRMTGFGDMTAEEISERTGLALEEARLAKERGFDEPFFLESGSVEALAPLVEARGLHLARGRILHMTGDNDKGRAIGVLKAHYRSLYGDIATIGLGDAPNDIPLLRAVDYPVLVKNRSGGYETVDGVPSLIRADGIGPVGWGKALTGILDSLKAAPGGYRC